MSSAFGEKKIQPSVSHALSSEDVSPSFYINFMFYNDSGKSLTLVSNRGVKCAVFPSVL